MIFRKLSFLLSVLCFGLFFSQKKEQLQRESAELKKQIALINSNLAKTQKEARLSIAHLNEVNKKIQLREKVYNNTQKEKRLIEDDIYLRQKEINKYKKELAVLRKNYAEILVKAYKNKGIQNKVTFILSAKNLGEALRRVQYLKQYSDYQDKKAKEISGKAAEIQQALKLKQKSVKEKENILTQQQKDLLVIQNDRKQRELLLEDFKKNEAALTAELKQKQAQAKKIEGEIRKIINEEIAAAKAKEEAERKARLERERLAREAAAREKARIDAENKARAEALERERKKAEAEAARLAEIERKKQDDARKQAELAKAEENARNEARRIAAEKDAREAAARAKAAEEKVKAARDAEAELAKRKEEEKKKAEEKTKTAFGVGAATGSNFAENRGRIGFPVERGQVTHRFGRQPHPVFKNIVEENNGIRIAVSPGTKARCVFPGEVSRISFVGGTKTVIVKHGSYFTIYSNLSDVSVSPNQKVSSGTTIGTIAQDFEGAYSLDFQIWNGSTPVDPMGWVSN
ncbi:peptidoglycan DD-metalloendopeptidase family protein [Riemerella anatipestifer]|uniref:M23 family metallopeptidase n=1 Tax=Riemerella anatipestifer TaxID=34085 RepID=UPI00069A9A49|nr:M23 family metallopeptidase [Riemerella anatipestifer]MDY3344735.1 peptidoglycan DD-metalloendopeptidase family protein [Riemerella anatipestifer]MDY3350444.1 peptidoglycan DD-metalloendopeptidase family protein [Riemerella anatipestifer]MDY3358118.1 peptidoglycan DD-metalloendopeptidase family protein [Riemerella anatipestifer]